MALITGSTTSVSADVGAAAAKALHAQPRPIDAGSLGHYEMSLTTGTIAAGSGSDIEIVQFRWTHASYLALVRLVDVQYFSSLGTGFTAGVADFGLKVARAWTADGSGGTTSTPTSNDTKLRTSFSTSNVGAIRVSSTAALTAGTKTLDTYFISKCKAQVTTAQNTLFLLTPNGVLYRPGPFEQPITLAAQEGFVVTASIPATGTWEARVRVAWSEVTAY
jgi:hypothetical protein